MAARSRTGRPKQPFAQLTLTRDNVIVALITTVVTIGVLDSALPPGWLTGSANRIPINQQQATEARKDSRTPDTPQKVRQATTLVPPSPTPTGSGSTTATRPAPGAGTLSELEARGGPGQVVVSWRLSGASQKQIRTTITGSDRSRPADNCRPTTTGCTFTGLTNGLEYAVAVSLTRGNKVITRQTVRAVPYPNLLTTTSTRLWFDAADPAFLLTSGPRTSGATVRRVLDRSASGADADPANGYTPPSLTTINGHSALHFDSKGGLRFPASALPSGSSPSTVYAVAAMDSSTASTDCFSHVMLWGELTPNGARALIKGCGNSLAYADTYDTWREVSPTRPWRTGRVQVMRADFTADTLAVWMDGALSYTWSQPKDSQMATGTQPNGMLGGTPQSNSGGWQGRIAEVIVVSQIPTSAENSMIMQYLQRKWGL